MAALIAQNLAPIMFVALVLFLLLGYPVAFSLGAVGLAFFVVGVELAPFSKCTALSSVCHRVGDQIITLDWPLLRSLPERIYGIMNNDTLLAIPFFTFMGLILERSGMAEDLLDTVGQLFGTLSGGLAYAVIVVGALLAATTGVVAASVISMGLISLPIMLRYGYDRRVASGTIAASGTLAQIIPPSIVLIVLADQLGRSVGDMYEGAFVPGLVLAGLYMGYVLLVTMLNPGAAPGLPAEAIRYREDGGTRGLPSLLVLAVVSAGVAWWLLHASAYKGADRVILMMAAAIAIALFFALANVVTGRLLGVRFLSRLTQQVTFVMVPPLALIFLVLGTIFIGVATPTEGGAMGAVGAMALGLAKRHIGGDSKRFSLEIVRSAAQATAKLSAFVMFILIGARIFSLTFYGVNGHIWVEHLLTSTPGGMYGFLILVNVAVFLLAFFLDFFELAFIIVPLLKPAAEAVFRVSPEAVAIASAFGIETVVENGRTIVADVTPLVIWFGVLLAINMQTSFMHPPFGFALFYLRSVAPKAPYLDKVTGRTMPPVTTAEIYWGAIPFVVIQVLMVALVLLLPGLVIEKRAPKPATAPDAPVHIELPRPMLPGFPGDLGPQMPGAVSLPSAGLALPGTPPGTGEGTTAAFQGPLGPTLDLSIPPAIETSGR